MKERKVSIVFTKHFIFKDSRFIFTMKNQISIFDFHGYTQKY